MTKVFKLSAAPAILAALSLTATPVLAADLPAPVPAVSVDAPMAWAPGEDVVHNHWYRYRRNRVDGGDILAGVLILGGIAAIASAAKNSQDRRYRDRDYPRPYPDQRRGDWNSGYDDTRGIDRAINTCVDEVERNARIETVDTVNRNARGWEVTGTLYNRDGWTCSIGQDGRIEAIDYGRGREDRNYQGSNDDDRGDQSWEERDEEDRGDQASDDSQYGDDYYAAARARTDAQGGTDATYPGGPSAGAPVDADIEFGTGYQGKGA
ncbi:hypothetical protein [Qipengyuania sp. RANM35]|uniref:hypothetical protein n=1 Tax=Qipengyuania sp. RANM35 TaxID=3068635 RepID=UPI0034DB41C6